MFRGKNSGKKHPLGSPLRGKFAIKILKLAFLESDSKLQIAQFRQKYPFLAFDWGCNMFHRTK